MRPFGIVIAALALVPGALAVDDTKSVIVWYDNAADSVVQQAMDAITSAGGQITHVYSLIK